jgi:chitosanase
VIANRLDLMNNQERLFVKGRIFGSPGETEQNFLVEAKGGVKIPPTSTSQPLLTPGNAPDALRSSDPMLSYPKSNGRNRMNLTESQRSLVVRVVNVFETGIPDGKYGVVSVFDDGPGRIKQITYGRSQTTEYGNLPDLLGNYVASGGRYSGEIAPFLPLLGTGQLVDNQEFISILKKAGDDPVMVRVQNSFFDEKYFRPAMGWADTHGFILALSFLVIYDSFIHSGGIRSFLRARFPEVPPAQGGPERAWTTAYVQARHQWLRTHSNELLRNTIYRTQCFQDQITAQNWDLEKLPVRAHGVDVMP